ncbi:MAG TPA: hypothetical protein VMX55_04870 [candidate division Zixibacteria bacterium]|nr:hypothetical protein [candidate division Zixibacteria bacterium]
MSNFVNSRSLIESKLQKDFRKEYKIQAEYFELSEKKIKHKIRIQVEKNGFKIRDYGLSFGVYYTENELIFANWVFNLPIKEKESIIQFLLIRESIRSLLMRHISLDNKYRDLIDLILNVLAILRYIEGNQFMLVSPPVIYIRGRLVFDEIKISHDTNRWEWVYIDSYNNKISAFKIFNKIIELITNSLSQNKSAKELEEEFLLWIDNLIVEENLLAMPIYLEPKYFEIIKSLESLGYVKSSAKNIGKLVNKSYNLVDKIFKEMYEKFLVFWRVNIDILKLKLYPYYFRIKLKDKVSIDLLVKKFRTVNYLKELDIFQTPDEIGFTGILECPHIIHYQLDSYFENLTKKGIIKDYFFQLIRRKKFICSITTKKIKSNEKNFRELYSNPSKYNIVTLTLLDEIIDIVNPPKFKPTIFEMNSLTFLSTIKARYLGKAHYMMLPLEKFYAMCKKNNLDTTESRKVKYFISQMDKRMRRLGVISYFLNIFNIGNFARSLYLEIIDEPESSITQKIIRKFEITSNLVIYEFYDRVVLQFPKVNISTPFTTIIKETLSQNNIKYNLYALDYYKKFVPPISVPYDELFDFKKKSWKI